MIRNQDVFAQANRLGRHYCRAFVDEHIVSELESRARPRTEAGRNAKPPHPKGTS